MDRGGKIEMRPSGSEDEAMTVTIVALAVVAALAAWWLLARRSAQQPRSVESDGAAPGATTVRITIDVDPRLKDTDAARRLIAEAAREALATSAHAVEVDVFGRGSFLATISRHASVRPAADLPMTLFEGAGRRRHAPAVRTQLGEEVTAGKAASVRFDPPDRRRPPMPLADAFDLPADVRERLRHPDDAVDIVRSILEAAGHVVDADRDTLRVGDLAFVVVRWPIGDALNAEALNHAYFRFQSSGARRGVVVATGILNSRDIQRRELLAPQLRHAGIEAIQRMADAVGLGADPLDFAAGLPAEGS